MKCCTAVGLLVLVLGCAAPAAPAADTEPASRPMAEAETPPSVDEIRAPDGDPAGGPHAWAVHDPARPQPPVVEPGTASLQARAGRAPSDAVVLFDGNAPDANLDAFVFPKQDSPGWHLRDGYVEVNPGAGPMRTAEKFGDVQVHLEWQVPLGEAGDYGQKRGNSGIFLMGLYEVQIGDSKQNRTYADGMAAAVYGQAPPLVNAGLGLDRWHTYDIIFRAPRFDEAGHLARPATVTVLHNGVLVQDHWVLEGVTHFKKRAAYGDAHGEAPFHLQDHGDPVRYRNLWVRRLPERPVSVLEAARESAHE